MRVTPSHRDRRRSASLYNNEALPPAESSARPSSSIIGFTTSMPVRPCRTARQVWAKPSVRGVLWLVGYPSMTYMSSLARRMPGGSPAQGGSRLDAGSLPGRTVARRPLARVEAVWTWLQAARNQVQQTTPKLAHPLRVHSRGQTRLKKLRHG